MIVYDNYLTVAQRRIVEGYLAWKWGIAPSLGTTFSPLTSLPNCAVWFDGADPTSFTLSGSNITQWRDKAGSNVTSNIGTPVYTSNAINGVPGVSLDLNAGFKISPMSNGANTTTVSIYGVVSAAATVQNNARIFTAGRVSDGQVNNDFSSTALWTLYQASSGTPTLTLAHASAFLYASNALTAGVPCLISAIFSGTAATLWANGSNRGSNATTDTLLFDRLGIGKNTNNDAGSGSDAWAGTVGEFLIFYAAHTEAQRLQVESYLASKWNIPTRAPNHLVPTHTYTKQRPFLREFLPTDLGTCALWLDSGDRSTLTLSSSNTVTGWTDKSGNRRPLTVNSAGTYSATGFNGRPTIQFVNGQYMTTSTSSVISNACTMFIVQQTGAATYQIQLAAGGGTNPYVFWWRGDFNSYAFNQEAIAGLGNNFYTTTGVPMVMTGVVTPNSGNYWRYYLNGTYQVDPNISGGINTAPLSNTGSSNVYIPGNLVQFGGPAGGGFTGNISEVLIFSNALSNAQRQLVENYLAKKWGLSMSMYGSQAHPFRYGPTVGVLPTSTPAPGCTLWIDAADATTMTLSGSNVTQWRDKSGNGYVGTSSGSPVLTTVDGVRAVTFNGSTQYFTFGDVADLGTTPLNLFVVSKFNTTADGAIIAKSSFGAVGRYSLLRSGGNLVPLVEGATTTNQPTVADTNITRRLLAWTWDRATQAIYQNGGTTPIVSSTFSDTTSLNTTFPFLVGAYNDGGTGGLPPQSGLYFNGSINEVLCFLGPMTTLQRQQVEGYLAAKWALSSSLPAGHPYKTGTQTTPMPATIPGCALWLDAQDASAYTLSGSNVTAVFDKSPNAWSLGTASTFTLNSTKFNTTYPSFYGTGGQLGYNASFTLAQPITAYFVGQAVTANSSTFLFDGATSTRCLIYQGATMNAGGEFAATNAGSVSNSHVMSALFNGSSSSMRLNGIVTTGDPGTSGFGGIRISARNTGGDGYPGHICELLIYSGAHTDTQRQQMEGYLSWKWGIPYRLPGGSTNTAALYKTLTTEFDPRSVGSCAAWFDAADSKTVEFATGSNMARWLDKSGLQNHMSTNSSNQGFWPVYTQNTLNGIPVVTFSNAAMIGGYASPTSTTPHTIFVVARPSAITGFHDLIQVSSYPNGGTTGVGVNLSTTYTSNKWFAGSLYGGADGDTTSNTVASTTRTDVVVATVWPGSNINTTVNGTTGLDSTQVTSSLTTKANGAKTSMGAHWYPPDVYYREFYFGYIAEVLVFSNALTVADRQRVEGYLAWKWGLQSQLPALHPYSNVKF